MFGLVWLTTLISDEGWAPPVPLHSIVEKWQEAIKYTLKMTSMKLGPTYIAALLSNPTMPFHVTSIGARIKRGCLVSRKDPSAKVLSALVSSAASPASQRGAGTPLRRGWDGAHLAHILIEWLGASSYIKQQRQVWAASKSFYSVLARHKGISLSSLVGDLRPPNGEVLRVSRVKLDCVANLLFRGVFQRLPDALDIFVYLDSSPQVRGNELFAASFEIYNRADDSWWFDRRHMRLVALGRDFLDAAGKTMALLWAIWLMVGPCWQQMRRFCSMIRVILTDMGTERLIYSMVDLLTDFFELMLGMVPDIPRLPRMFPNCISMPGWMHGWDVIPSSWVLLSPLFSKVD